MQRVAFLISLLGLASADMIMSQFRYPSDKVFQRYWSCYMQFIWDWAWETNYNSGPGPVDFGILHLDETYHYEAVDVEAWLASYVEIDMTLM